MADDFGERLRALRLTLGKSQIEVSRELRERYPSKRTSQTTVSSLESRATAPRGEVLQMLADYYGVSQSYFVVESNDTLRGIQTTVTPYEMHFLDLYRREQYAQLLREIADCLIDSDETE